MAFMFDSTEISFEKAAGLEAGANVSQIQKLKNETLT